MKKKISILSLLIFLYLHNIISQSFPSVDSLVKAGKFEEGLHQLDSYIAEWESPKQLAEVHLLKKDIYKRLGQFPKGLQSTRTAIKTYKKLNQLDSVFLGKLYNELSDIFLYSDGDSVIYYAHLSNKVLSTKDSVMMVRNYSLLGFLYIYQSLPDSSLKYLNLSKEIADNFPEEEAIQMLVNSRLAIFHFNRGEYEKALPYYHTVFQHLKSIHGEDHINFISAQNNLAVCYMNMDDFERCIPMFKKVENLILKRFGRTHYSLATCYTNLGSSYFYLKKFENSLKYFKDAYDLRKQNFPDRDILLTRDLLNISKNEILTNNLEKAQISLHKADGILQDKSLKEQAEIHYYQGLIAHEQRDYKNALFFYHQALEILGIEKQLIMSDQPPSIFRENSIVIILLNSLGKSYLELYKNSNDIVHLDQADRYNRFAKTLTESMFNQYEEIESISRQAGELKEVFETKLSIIQERFDLNNDASYLLFMSQIMRDSRTLIFNQNMIRNYQSTRDEAFEKLIKKTRDIRDTMLFHIENNNDFDSNSKPGYLFNLQKKYYQLEDSIKYRLKLSVPGNIFSNPLEIPPIQQLLKNKYNSTAILDFFYGHDQLIMSIITKDTIIFQFMDLAKDSLNTYLDNFIYYFSLNAERRFLYRDTFQVAASRIYEQLLKPYPILNNLSNLLIIPDGKLHFVPFDALISTSFEGTPRYLLYKYNISYIYSLNQLFFQEHQKKKKNYLGFAPFDALGIHDDVTNPFSILRDSISDLPFSKSEIINSALFFQGDKYFGPAANKQTLLDRSKEYNIIHLATHAFISVNPNSEASGILFKNEFKNEPLSIQEVGHHPSIQIFSF